MDSAQNQQPVASNPAFAGTDVSLPGENSAPERPAPDGSRSHQSTQVRRASRRQVSFATVLGVASFGVFMAFVDATIVNVAIPDISRSFGGPSLGSLSWVLNAYNLVFAAFLVPAGRLSDLVGRKRSFEFGVLLFTAASLLCSIAGSLELLIGARILQAVGSAIMVPASLALVLEAAEVPRRARAVALWGSSAAVAAGTGPAVGGALVDLWSWRLAFLVNLPIGLAAVLLSRRKLVESRAPGRRFLPDLAGALLFGISVASLTLAIVQGDSWGWGSARILAAFLVAAGSAAYLVRRCSWHRAPIFELAFVRERSLAVANGLTLIASAGYFGYLLANVLFLTSVWNYSVLEAGLALTPGPIVAALVAAPLGHVFGRWDYRLVVIPGAAIWLGGVVLLIVRMGATPDFTGDWLPAILVLGIGAGATLPALGAAAVAAAPGGRFATATGLNSVSRQLGAVAGVAILVAVLGEPAPAQLLDAFDRGWEVAAGCFLGVAALAPFLGRIAMTHAVEEDAQTRGTVAREQAAPTALAPRLPEPPAEPRGAAAARQSTLDELLASATIFSKLSPEVRRKVAAAGDVVRLAGGEWLFRAGDVGDSLFVVLAGRCQIVDAEGNVFLVVGRGYVLGEFALLTGAPRAASVRALRDTELLELPRDEFERLLREEQAFVLELTAELARQLQASRPRAAPQELHATSLVLVPLSEGAPCAEIGDGLAAAFRRWDPVALVRAGELPSPGELDALESRRGRILVLADPTRGDAAATRAALQQADRIIAVASDVSPPRWIAEHASLQGCDLVLSDGALSRGDAAPWIDALAPRATHRLTADGFEGDVARLARRLAGRAPALVLSGGGARALAHIGVIDELERAGVIIDRVGGTSMGAFIGAMLAAGMDAAEIDAHCYEEFVRRSPLTDYRLPRTSLIRGGRMKEMLLRVLPRSIEALPKPFFCVSCDLVAGRRVVHRHGSLPHAVGASMCLPGFAPPSVGEDRRLLVDGGILDNLPVDIMRSADEGPVLAVDVAARLSFGSEAGGSARRRRRHRLHADWPWDEDQPMPTFAETLTRLITIASVDAREATRNQADLLIEPYNDDVGLLEFHQLDRMAEAGRRATAAALESASPELLSRLTG